MQDSRSSADAVCPITDGLNNYLHLDIGDGILLEKVDKCSYLGICWMQMEDVTASQICLEKVS